MKTKFGEERIKNLQEDKISRKTGKAQASGGQASGVQVSGR